MSNRTNKDVYTDYDLYYSYYKKIDKTNRNPHDIVEDNLKSFINQLADYNQGKSCAIKIEGITNKTRHDAYSYTNDITQSDVQVLVETHNKTTTNYLYGLDRESKVDEALNKENQAIYLYNGQNDVVQLIQDQEVLYHHYQDYGQLSHLEGYGYKGEYTEGNLQYLRFRYLDLDSGRFLVKDDYLGSEDPITQNRYTFVNNNPINHGDPSGHYPTSFVRLTPLEKVHFLNFFKQTNGDFSSAYDKQQATSFRYYLLGRLGAYSTTLKAKAVIKEEIEIRFNQRMSQVPTYTPPKPVVPSKPSGAIATPGVGFEIVKKITDQNQKSQEVPSKIVEPPLIDQVNAKIASGATLLEIETLIRTYCSMHNLDWGYEYAKLASSIDQIYSMEQRDRDLINEIVIANTGFYGQDFGSFVAMCTSSINKGTITQTELQKRIDNYCSAVAKTNTGEHKAALLHYVLRDAEINRMKTPLQKLQSFVAAVLYVVAGALTAYGLIMAITATFGIAGIFVPKIGEIFILSYEQTMAMLNNAQISVVGSIITNEVAVSITDDDQALKAYDFINYANGLTMVFVNVASQVATAYSDSFPGDRGKAPTESELDRQGAEKTINLKEGKGYNSFRDFKKENPVKTIGNQQHHIVEQSQINKSGFTNQQIHNTNNIVEISAADHHTISGYYSKTSFDFTNGLSIRNWLAGQSFEEQYKFGIKVLNELGIRYVTYP